MELTTTNELLSAVPNGPAEGVMIEQNQWCLVRALHEGGLNKAAIARELGLDVKTVRKWLTKTWQPQQRNRSRALDKFETFLRARAPEVGFNAAVLLREVQGLGYQGSYPVLARYIRPWRDAAQVDLEPTLRFETEPGKQAQVDWGSTGLWLGDERVCVHLFVMVLGYSRRIFAKAYLNERMESLFDGHAAAFAHFGGRTETILYDNPRTIVLDKDEISNQVTWNPTFKDRMDFYGLEIRLCRYYRAQTKGKVESGVKYVKGNALAGRRFVDLDHLNEWLLEWCLTVADERLHGTTHERPHERFQRAEATALIRVDARPVPTRERLEQRIVPRDALVVVETNRYPVPVQWTGQQVQVRLLPEEIIINCDGAEAIRHRRLSGKFEVARWQGAPRSFIRPAWPGVSGPPRFDLSYAASTGVVEPRELSAYAALVEEVAR